VDQHVALCTVVVAIAPLSDLDHSQKTGRLAFMADSCDAARLPSQHVHSGAQQRPPVCSRELLEPLAAASVTRSCKQWCG